MAGASRYAAPYGAIDRVELVTMTAAQQLQTDLGADGVSCVRLSLGEGVFLLVCTQGGRVFGPFLGGQDPLGWWPAQPTLAERLRDGSWNIGGERIWLAPESLFNFTDPHRIIDTYRVDPALDPVAWQLERRGRSLHLSFASEISLASGARIGVQIDRTLRPMGKIPAASGVSVVGYRQSVEVRQTDGVPIPVIPWIIRQVAPGGTAFMTSSGAGKGASVFGEPPETALTPKHGNWLVALSGSGFFKTAYHRDAVGDGHQGYLGPTVDGAAFAVLYRPRQAIAAAYPEGLPHDTGATGQAASLFYDSGRFGAYGELELYGHRNAVGAGILMTDCLFLWGPVSGLREWMGLPDA